MLNIHPYQLDIPKMSEKQWNDLINSFTAYMRETRPDEPIPSFEQQKQSVSKIPDLQIQVVFWLIYDDQANCVGYYSVHHPKPESPDYEANKNTIYFEPVVLAPYRRKGVGTQLLPMLINYAQNVGASWVQWDTKFESGYRFSEKLGATEAGRQRANRLTVDQLDWDMMQQWVDEGRSRNPDVELIRFTNLPAPALIDPFCDLVTAINRLQPMDDLEGIRFTLTPEEFEKQVKQQIAEKIECVVYCTREADHVLSGMTNLFYSKSKPTHAFIRQTGVRREYQNRGLGKWLKAAMMLHMRQSYPDVKFVDTENFNNNRPMMSINDRMGFKLFEQFIFYKIRVHDLAAKIDQGLPGHPDNS